MFIGCVNQKVRASQDASHTANAVHKYIQESRVFPPCQKQLHRYVIAKIICPAWKIWQKRLRIWGKERVQSIKGIAGGVTPENWLFASMSPLWAVNFHTSYAGSKSCRIPLSDEQILYSTVFVRSNEIWNRMEKTQGRELIHITYQFITFSFS